MTGRRRRLLRAGLLAGAALVVASALWAVLQAVAATTREDRVRLSGSPATVSLQVDQGDLDVRAAGRGVVEAVARERSFLVGIGGEAEIDDREAVLRWACRLWTSCRVDVRARVPEDVALEARSGLGDVTVTGPVGDVELRTRSGRIDARALGGRRARVEARQGDVLLMFTDAPVDVTVEVSSGDVEIAVPAGLEVPQPQGLDPAASQRPRLGDRAQGGPAQAEVEAGAVDVVVEDDGPQQGVAGAQARQRLPDPGVRVAAGAGGADLGDHDRLAEARQRLVGGAEEGVGGPPRAPGVGVPQLKPLVETQSTQRGPG